MDERSSDVEEDDGLMEEIRAKIKECQARVEMLERDSVDGHVNDCDRFGLLRPMHQQSR